MNPKRVGVGVGVIVFKDGKVAMGFRKSSHGAETWSLPGGEPGFGEPLLKCAEREVFEETGLKIKNARIVCVNDDFFEKEDKHFATIGVVADWAGGELTEKERDKFAPLKWFALNDLPRPLFPPSAKSIECFKEKKTSCD